jgi:hypothetical protein
LPFIIISNLGWHYFSSVSAAIVRLVYGHQIRNHNDILVTLAESLGSLTDTASEPGRWLVDSFPACKLSTLIRVWYSDDPCATL